MKRRRGSVKQGVDFKEANHGGLAEASECLRWKLGGWVAG